MLTLAYAGWSAPKVPVLLSHCCQTVRDMLKDFLGRGIDSLYPRRTGPAPETTRRHRVAEELRRSLAQDWAWTPASSARCSPREASASAPARSADT